MKEPSIEHHLSRASKEARRPRIARALHDWPILGAYIRAWARATRDERERAQWAALPPVVA
ncbi:MAG TPA: hypothetical protein VNU25_03720 [Candidatus Paceibacterota bacterium]|nr:hypothetical protein [Candidatus Paceibacterota bacterium]